MFSASIRRGASRPRWSFARRRSAAPCPDEGGSPIPGATLNIEMRPLAEKRRFSSADSIKTDAEGGFTWRVSARLVPRDQADDATRVIDGGLVRLLSRRRSASRRTGRERATGGPYVHRHDRRRSRRAYAPGRSSGLGGRWVPFANATVRDGRFTPRYMFKRTFGHQLPLPRRPADDPNFPYAAATSK